MVSEEVFFISQGLLHCNFIDDVLLRSVSNSDKSQLQRNLLIQKHFLRVSTFVHDVYFRDDSDRSFSSLVEVFGELESVRSGHIGIGWDHTQNNCSLINAISLGHLCCYFENVLLTLHIDSRNTGQIDDCEIRAIVRIDCQLDWVVYDSRCRSRYLIGFVDDSLAHLREVCVSFSFVNVKYSI